MIHSIIPLLEELKLIHHGQTVFASPFKIINPSEDERKLVSIKDIQNI